MTAIADEARRGGGPGARQGLGRARGAGAGARARPHRRRRARAPPRSSARRRRTSSADSSAAGQAARLAASALVEAPARLLDPLAVRERPGAERLQRPGEARAERRQGVLDARRDLGVHAAADEAVALHRAQRLGQHLLGDRLEVGEQLVVAAGAVAEREQHVDRPLRGQQAERVVDQPPRAGALGAATGSTGHRADGHRYCFPTGARVGVGTDGCPAVVSVQAGPPRRRRQRLVGDVADHEAVGRRLRGERDRRGRRGEGVARREVRGGHGERERHRQRDGADEVHDRLAAGAAAHRHPRRGLEVEAEALQVLGQLRPAAHPADPSARPSARVSVRNARDTRSRAAFWLQPSRPATSW